MAALTVTKLTSSIAPGGIVPLNFFGEDGMICEAFAVPGGTAADTVTITPDYISDIRTVMTSLPADNNLNAAAVNPSVVLTLRATVAGTRYDIWVVGRR